MNHEGHKGHEGKPKETLDPKCESIGKLVLDACYAVHSQLGAGLLESVYETCIAIEFDERKIAYQRQLELPLIYNGNVVDAAYRLDFLVEGCVVIELKAVSEALPIHEAQLLTYMKLSKVRLGYLINFNSVHLRQGVRRFVL